MVVNPIRTISSTLDSSPTDVDGSDAVSDGATVASRSNVESAQTLPLPAGDSDASAFMFASSTTFGLDVPAIETTALSC